MLRRWSVRSSPAWRRPTAASRSCSAEVTGHLRALLRDVLCGHLDSDLRSVADRLLAEEGAAA